MHWDDFKFFSAVVRHRTIRAAARALGVHPSTVSRRIDQFERRLGVKLFKRAGQSLVLTPAGIEASGNLHHIEQELSGIEHALRQGEDSLAGWVRAAAPDFLFLGGLFDGLADFTGSYPNIHIEWTDPAAEAHADIALKLTANPPLDLIGREVGGVRWALYTLASRADEAAGLGWIEVSDAADDKAVASTVAALQQQQVPEAPKVACCHGLSQLLPLLRAGVGAAALPRLLGDQDASLKRLPGTQAEPIPLWLLMAPEVRRNSRVLAFRDYLLEALNNLPDASTGAASVRG